MGHAADFGDALLEAGFVAYEVIAHQLAVPSGQEVARMFTGTAWTEVLHHRFQCRERCGAVRPDVCVVCFLFAWRQYLHRRFIGKDDLLSRYGFAQRIYQRLQFTPVWPTH